MTMNLEASRRPTISHAALSAGLALSSAAFADAAFAQQRPANQADGRNIELDAINVAGQPGVDTNYLVPDLSSPKSTAPLLNTPQTITVIPQAIIREQGARNLTEVLRNTPGISFDAGENGFATSTNNFKIRGFDSSGSVFIDGARDAGSYTRDIFNTERVEVVKGAASDNGRGGAGGYVNMVTKTPHLRNFFSGDFGYGFDDYNSISRKRGTVDFNYVLAPHTAFRFNGLLEESGVAGREVAEMRPRGVAPSIAFGLGTDLRAIFAFEHVTRKDLPDWGVPGATIPGTVRYSESAAGAHRDAFYGLKSDFDNTASNAILARLEYDISKGVTISNQTRWAEVDRVSRFTTPTGFLPATREVTTSTQFYDRRTTTLSNLTNLAGEFHTGLFQHNVSLGLDITREESDANRYAAINPGNTSLFNPDPDRSMGFPLAPTERNGVKVDTIAAYLYDTVKLNEHWQINGGLRAERYNVSLGSTTVAGAPAGLLNGFEDSATTLGGKIGIVYKPVQNGSIYASYSVSHQPPGSYLSNPDISREGDNAFPGFVQGAGPVRADNYEIGVKWDFFNKRLSATAALFRAEKSNVAITGRDPGDTVDSLKGYGEQIVQGVEFGVAGRITEAWQVFGGLAIIDSERKHSAYLDDVRRRASPGDYVGLDGTQYTSTNGDELAFTPRVTGNVWTTYRLPFGLTVGGGVQYVGSSYLGRPDDANRIIPNGVFGKLPSYFLVHAMAAYEVSKNVDIRVNIDNIADETYAVSTNWGGTRATLGAPRTYRISTNFRF